MSLVASTVGVVGAGSRTRVEAGLGEDVKPGVAAVLDPLVVPLGEHSADEADRGVTVGEDADDVGAAADLAVAPFWGTRSAPACRSRRQAPGRAGRGPRWRR
jgi:hypothetical protein